MSAATTNIVLWEKMTLTVDSRASDTVIQPHMLAWLETLHTDKVETEYEVTVSDEFEEINSDEEKIIMKKMHCKATNISASIFHLRTMICKWRSATSDGDTSDAPMTMCEEENLY